MDWFYKIPFVGPDLREYHANQKVKDLWDERPRKLLDMWIRQQNRQPDRGDWRRYTLGVPWVDEEKPYRNSGRTTAILLETLAALQSGRYSRLALTAHRSDYVLELLNMLVNSAKGLRLPIRRTRQNIVVLGDCVLYALPHDAVAKIQKDRVYLHGLPPVDKVFQDHFRIREPRFTWHKTTG